MSEHSVPAIDSTVHLTNVWLKELCGELGRSDRRFAYRALRAVLHALRDRLTVAEVVDLGAQLPLLVRGIFYEGWSAESVPRKELRVSRFIEEVGDEFREDPSVSSEEIVWAVFGLLERHVSPGEIDDVQGVLSPKIRKLWPDGAKGHG